MKKQVQLMPLEVQQVLSPADCKLIIQAFEAGRAPQVNDPERIIGIYIVLLTGEAVLYDFDVLQIFIDKERPEAEVYIKAYEEKQAAKAQA